VNFLDRLGVAVFKEILESVWHIVVEDVNVGIFWIVFYLSEIYSILVVDVF